jgi:hypothetical protein
MMSGAEFAEISGARIRGASVEQAVGDVKRPGFEAKYGEDPQRWLDVGGPRESESPNDGHGGGVEAGEMPHA